MDFNKQSIHGGKVYRTVSSLAITGVFFTVGLLVFAFSGYLVMSRILTAVLTSVAVLCIGALMSLSWIKRLENGIMKKLSVTFISIILGCAVMWLIAIWAFIIMSYNVENITPIQGAGLILFVKIVVILSLQLIVASFIAAMVTRFKATYVPFQAISFISYLFVDFYITFALLCVRIKLNSALDFNEMFVVSDNIGILGTRLMFTLLILAIVFIGATNGIIRAMYTRQARQMAYILDEQDQELVEKRLNRQLEDLQTALNNGTITQAEYDEKRTDLLRRF